MGDFDFEELDKAVNNVLGDSDVHKDVALMAAGPSDITRTPSPDSVASPAVPTPSDTTVSAAATPQIIKPRSSVNRAAPPIAERGAIDIVAPSKRPSRELTLAAPNPRGGMPDVQPIDQSERPAMDNIGEIDDAKQAAVSVDADTKIDNTDVPADSAVAQPTDPEPAIESEDANEVLHTSDDHENGSAEKLDTDVLEADKRGDLEKFNQLSSSGLDNTTDSSDMPDQTKNEDSALSDDAHQEDASPTVDLDAVKEELEKAAVEPLSVEETDQQPANPAAPAVSPFLVGTKVDKRPLGGAPIAANDEASATDVDVLSSQNDASSSTEKGSTPPEKEESASSHVIAGGQPHGSYKSSDDIPQQYKVATGDTQADATHPVFDTHEYHAAVDAHGSFAQKLKGNGLLIGAMALLVIALITAVIVFFFADAVGL